MIRTAAELEPQPEEKSALYAAELESQREEKSAVLVAEFEIKLHEFFTRHIYLI